MTEENNKDFGVIEDSEGGATVFSMAELPQNLRDAALRMGWTELMPVQQKSIPYMLDGQDVMIQSQTGSGKTGAFLLPILHRMESEVRAPQALVLSPTRELAVQVSREAEELGREAGVSSLPIYGGVGYKAQIQGLEAGAQLIIGTPGRILDHLLKGTLNLDHLKTLIFDEADRMLSMGFYPDMKQLQRYLPRGLQSAMFSATYPGHVKRLAQQFLKDPVFVSLSQEQVHASDVLHVVYKVPAMQKSRILVKIIELENPASAIIFCNTKADVHFVSVVLRRFGYDVGEISADLTQSAREDVLEKLRRNKLKFLVATDVAARGIDIHELSHVFQYQPPQDHEAYVHRTGRTGRAGAAGVAISFVSGMEEIELEQIAKKFSIQLEERAVPEDEELETIISQRAVFLLEAQLRGADNIQRERMQRFMSAVSDLAASEDSRLLLAMLVDEFYQKTFHAPLEQPTERLVAPVQPAQRPVRPVMEPSPARSDGDKRRRKRGRKKPSAGDTSATPVASAPGTEAGVLVAGNAGGDAQKQQTPGDGAAFLAKTPSSVSVTEVADFGGGLESIWDQSPVEEKNDGAVPAKKRRRRRPRKPSVAKPSQNAEGASVGHSVAAPEPERTTSREVLTAEPRRQPRPEKRPDKRETETPKAVSKTKKKIFLE